MSSITPPGFPAATDESQPAALGYSGDFHRSMSLWSNLALGFTYLSPRVGVYSLFADSLSLGPADYCVRSTRDWIVLIGAVIVIGVGLLDMAVAKPYETRREYPKATRSRSRDSCVGCSDMAAPVTPEAVACFHPASV